MKTDRIELLDSIDNISTTAWHELLAESNNNSVFSTLEWLQAWKLTLGRDRRLLIPLCYRGDRLIGALPLENRNGIISFGATERRDYCDVLILRSLDDADKLTILDAMLKRAAAACKDFKHFDLKRIPADSPLVSTLQGGTSYHATKCGETSAPRMDMSVVETVLRKKSLRRHANALARMGSVECVTLREAAKVEPLLESFFDQHIRRWHDTPSPSLFLDPEIREFYRALTTCLGNAGSLRFSTVRLDGALVAAHFGFLHNGIFTWYKPSFEPELAKKSPGEVLIKYLLEVAQSEEADVFDFTIGSEAFKMRFATEIPDVVDLNLTDSLIAASLKRGRGTLAKLVRG
jgi:CelD/BcsL family acetyltransferase involved in cellulose biosynthesis